MNISTINTTVGMQSIQQKIDTIANNISNINTIGYKSREVFFHDILSGPGWFLATRAAMLNPMSGVKNKNPLLGLIATWLVPGAGHYYLGVRAKALYYFLLVTATFLLGVALSRGCMNESFQLTLTVYVWVIDHFEPK